jgi:hypothetical protein
MSGENLEGAENGNWNVGCPLRVDGLICFSTKY